MLNNVVGCLISFLYLNYHHLNGQFYLIAVYLVLIDPSDVLLKNSFSILKQRSTNDSKLFLINCWSWLLGNGVVRMVKICPNTKASNSVGLKNYQIDILVKWPLFSYEEWAEFFTCLHRSIGCRLVFLLKMHSIFAPFSQPVHWCTRPNWILLIF